MSERHEDSSLFCYLFVKEEAVAHALSWTASPVTVRPQCHHPQHSVRLPQTVKGGMRTSPDRRVTSFAVCRLRLLWMYRPGHAAVKGDGDDDDDDDDDEEDEVVVVEVLLYVHRNRRFIRDGSQGHPPRLSHSS